MRRTRFFLLVVAVSGLLASSCVGSSETGDTCKCPTLIEEASSIDWIGDGQPAREVISDKAPGSRPLQVDLIYNTPDSDEVLVAIAERLIDAGYSPVEEIALPLNRSIRFEETGWEVHLGGVQGDDGALVRIRLYAVKPDSRAAEVLAPLAEALGTIP